MNLQEIKNNEVRAISGLITHKKTTDRKPQLLTKWSTRNRYWIFKVRFKPPERGEKNPLNYT